MDLPFFNSGKQDISRLVDAVKSNKNDDTFWRFMTPKAWDVLAEYVRAEKVERGQILIAEGALDRTLYFIESGVLRVHYGSASSPHVALISPGSVVGEGSFFSQIPRNATVQATQSGVLWGLSPKQFDTMAKRNTDSALALAMALGAVISTRMLDVSRKIAVT